MVQAVVGRAFDRLAEEIARYEGLLEKFMGDAILAVFGVPRAHEDDADRAVRAALEMQAVLSELNGVFAEEGKPQLAMRIGVEAGEVLVDLERASGPRDRMLTGDAVNTAARLQTAAEPGRVLVGPGVHEATRDVIEYRELPALDLKGKADPVHVWEALRIRARQRGERPELGMQATFDRAGRGALGPGADVRARAQRGPARARDGRRPRWRRQDPARARVRGVRRGVARVHPLASWSLPGLRERHVFRARGRDQGAVRGPRGRRGRRRAEEDRGRRRGAVRRHRVRATGRRAPGGRRAWRVRSRGAVRRLAAVLRAHGGALPAGPAVRGHPLGRRRAARLHRVPGRLGAGPT